MSGKNKPKAGGTAKAGDADTAAAKAAATEAAKKAAEEAAAAEAAKKAAEEAAAAKAAAASGASSNNPGTVKKVNALRVTSKRDGFRRAGRAWSKEATVVSMAELSEEQIEQIKGEPMLDVAEIEIDAPAAE